MKVKEIIKALKPYHPDAEVVAYGLDRASDQNVYADLLCIVRQEPRPEGEYKVLLYLSLKWRATP